MTIGAWTLAFAPLAGWVIPSLILGLGLALAVLGALRGSRAAGLRASAFLALWLLLVNPSLVAEQRVPRASIGVVLVDESASQGIGDRKTQAERALQAIEARARNLPNLELRVVRAGGEADTANGGTRLFSALERAVDEIPRDRYAGAIIITDGQIHDAPRTDAPERAAALHALLTGAPGQRDRRLAVVRAPSFGLVDRDAEIVIRVDDEALGPGATVSLSMRRDGLAPETLSVAANRDVTLPVPIAHGGETVLELEAAAGPEELTLVNNRAVVTINGVRDRLRVLLITGEPHPGERVWRNFLKSDPSVDLVHFTILRSPDKQDGTPINELSLIAFPIRELFEVRLNQFDLIIFDRYRRRNILPTMYLQAVADYVERGGAVLEAAGPSDATSLSLAYTPLGEKLPGEPTGKMLEQRFKPTISSVGARHPVTDNLDGHGRRAGAPPWGAWFRQVEMTQRRGQALMTGADGLPLLLLDRVGEGRIAQLASDQIWLWARGYEGGGPQGELLRRLAHWLMKEPALEEEDLSARVVDGTIEVTRRSLTSGAATIEVTAPDGTRSTMVLPDAPNGKAIGRLPAAVPGLYRFGDGRHVALAAVGAINPREFADVRATDAVLTEPVETARGAVAWIGQGSGPELRMIDTDAARAGRGWIGLVDHRAYDVTGLKQIPLIPPEPALVLAAGLVLAAWRREGR